MAEDNLFLTNTSGYMAAWYTPYGMSCKVNPWIVSYILNNRYKNKGIVAFDYVDFALSKLMIDNNFPEMNIYTGLNKNITLKMDTKVEVEKGS